MWLNFVQIICEAEVIHVSFLLFTRVSNDNPCTDNILYAINFSDFKNEAYFLLSAGWR